MKIRLVTVLFVVTGCASPRAPHYVALPRPPAEEVRAQLGSVVVVQSHERVATQFTQPMGKGRSVGNGALVGFVGGLFAPGGGGILLAPLGGIGGAIYGGVAGMSKKEFNQVSAILQEAVQEEDLASRLQVAVRDSIQQLILGSATSRTSAPPVAPTALELIPTAVRLTGTQEIKPPLTFECVVCVRLLRGSDSRELFSDTFKYTGAVHTLRDWAAHDAKFMRTELASAVASLPGPIAEQLFLVYPLPDNPAQQRVLPWPPPKQR